MQCAGCWVSRRRRLLRSEKMENIIFNGTKSRKPANLAEVSLTFENNKGILPTEYSTVSITRRLYRSGESEYLLNGVTCRLKDINDLFLDTGIGPDSYAIIELNMVDDILKDRNNTIKTLLEEAAGISKYKIRKRQTFQKLEETDADLNRVNDLLFEIEKSLKQLESQAKKTDRYYRLREEYRTLSTQLALYSIRHHASALTELQQREQEQHIGKAALQEELEKLEVKLQEMKTNVLEKEKQYQATQKAMNEKLLEITRFENEEKNKNERLQFLVEKQKQLQQQAEQDDKSLIDVSASLVTLQEEKVREEEHLKQLEETVTRQREESERSKQEYEASQVAIRELNQQTYQLRTMINEFETKAAVKHTRYNSIQEEIKRYHQQQEESAAKLKAIEEELSTQVPEKEKAENELQRLRQLRGELEDNIRLSENRQKELNQVLQAESRKLDARHNEYQLTKNLLEQMEGYPESIRYLKKSNDKFKQAPLLSDIIVCEEPFKVAIENFLEPYLNHFVVDTMQDAWEALESLSSSAKGRANFFVLDSLKQFQGKNANAMEGCTPALSAVERNGKYDALYAMLLSHVYILDKDRSLQDYHIGEDQSLVVLSQTGHFLRQKYAVGGGSIGAFDGKRTGKFRNLEKLAEEMQHQEKVVEEYKEQVKLAETELVELKSQLDQTRQSLSKQESDFMRLNGQVNSLQSNAQFLSNNLEQSKNNSKRLEDEATGIQRLLEEEQNNPELSPAYYANASTNWYSSSMSSRNKRYNSNANPTTSHSRSTSRTSPCSSNKTEYRTSSATLATKPINRKHSRKIKNSMHLNWKQ
jgi:chromosome segregation protein